MPIVPIEDQKPLDFVSLGDALLSASLIGGKGYNLTRLTKIKGITTKPGLVMTSSLYKKFVKLSIQDLLASLKAKKSDRQGTIALLEKIKKTILELTISSFSESLSSLEPGKYYAVRSSGTAEDGMSASFSGKFETLLYVKKKDIINAVKTIWASVFELNNLEYCQANDIDFEEISMAVVIQEMSNPIAAGTVFTDSEKTVVDVAPGLGDAVVKGDKPTDRVVLDAATGRIVFTEASKKRTRLVYNSISGEIIDQPLFQHEFQSLSITPAQIKELNNQVKLLKKAYPECQHGLDIEFSCDLDGHVYILQVRPVTTPALDDMKQVDSKKSSSHYIGKGEPVSHHIKSGILAVCSTPEAAERALLSAQKKQKKIIIVTANTTSQWESVMRRSAGVIAEVGSTNCHTAIACREMKISGITAYEEAMTHLKAYHDQEVTLCGASGKIYRGNLTASGNLTSCKLETKYTPIETEEIMSKLTHLSHASKAGMTCDHDGQPYIGKPLTPTCELVNQLDLAAHQFVQKEVLQLSDDIRYHITDNNIFLVLFDDCHEWRVKVRAWSIKKHQDILVLRQESEKLFLDASENLELTESSMQRWYSAYVSKIGYDNIAYPIGEVLNGKLHQAAKTKGVKEPVLSELVPAEISCMGHFELEKAHDEIRQIQAILLKNPKTFELVKRLEEMYSAEGGDYSVITKNEVKLIESLKKLGLYKKCKALATSYRIQEKDFSLTFLDPWFQQSSTPWLRLLVETKKLTGPAPQPSSTRKKKFFPEDGELRSLIELSASSKKSHMDGHHAKARGLWCFINKMQELSEKTGYPVSDLLSKPYKEIVVIVKKANAQTKPGATPRKFNESQEQKLKSFSAGSGSPGPEQTSAIMSFCDNMPSAVSFSFKKTNGPVVFSHNSDGLPKLLEEHEEQMSDVPGLIPPSKYRGEYVRPNRHGYTQRQIAAPNGRVITMVDLSQGKGRLTLLDNFQIGKPNTYSASFKWRNPAFSLEEGSEFHSENHDRIRRYSEIIDKSISPGFSKKSPSDRISILISLKNSTSSISQHKFFNVALNTNSGSKKIQTRDLIDKLLSELAQDLHKCLMTGSTSSVIYGIDGAAPKMQPVVRVPAAAQHETFLENALYFINKWSLSALGRSLDEKSLFEMSEPDLHKFLNYLKVDSEGKALFLQSLVDARKFREYQRKPKVRADLDDGSVVEVSMNDAIDIPSQALMLINKEGDVMETNRPVNLLAGYRSLHALLKNKFSGKMQAIIFSQLAYTQASSTQSLSHFHIVPVYNSEGQFVVPYLEGKEDEFGVFENTSIKGVSVSYLDEAVQKDYFNLVRFKINLSSDEASNLQVFKELNQKLQLWETQIGCDMTWVAKFIPAENAVIMCVELRAGINQFTQEQIDGLRESHLWNKIGFTEVMGRKYSMLSQENLDTATIINNEHTALRKKMLETPLHCIQVAPDGSKTFYQFQDEEIEVDELDEQKVKSIIHIARVLQAFDAETYTITMAALYHLYDEEMSAFKGLFKPSACSTEEKAGERSYTSPTI